MKITWVLTALVMIGGLGAGYIAYKHYQQTNDQTRDTILHVVNELKQSDNSMNTLILESRYGLSTDYDDLAHLVVKIQHLVDEFSTGKLAEYALQNAVINQQLQALYSQLALKLEVVENFKSHNAILRNSISYAPKLGDRLIGDLEDNNHITAAQQLKVIKSD